MINSINNVSSKGLWNISLNFINKIDSKQSEYNIKLAYIVSEYAKTFHLSKIYLKYLLLISTFYNVGKLYERNHDGDSLFETYLFLKYFSPVGEFSEILLKDCDDPFASKFFVAKYFTDNFIKYNNQYIAYEKTVEEHKNITIIDKTKLKEFISHIDLNYDFNSMKYKTIIYTRISNSFFGPREKYDFIIMLSSLFEMYSSQTLNHSKSTAIIARNIAKKLDLSKNRQNDLYVAGLVHDLGKVCVPLKILEKDSKLTEEEYEIMKTHVKYTKEIIQGQLSYEIIEIAYRHHERLDGSGYPNKISAEYLTFDQRILEVSDVVSALLMKRSYKEAFSWEKCIDILASDVSNNKLDGIIVNVVKDNKDEIDSIFKELYEDTNNTYLKIEKEREKFYSEVTK